ncbi:efflux RND transporter periplasmic adaptor subunit [Calothrix rhizosoleniae]|uniref:efflux RND transporter periplasmic adaptor subunit n=1 Tax=Calothrix rhizosoleniae TaxID=888997 RepID=UPI000B4A3391|nr:efflux RND transporter periplasmic adaptor subunit [Calothrix rhizosoleniae]
MVVRHIELPVIGKVKHPRLWLMGLIGVITAGTIGIVVVSQVLVKSQISEEKIRELTIPVVAKNITLRIPASGKIVPIESVNISPKNPGILESLMVEQGDRVKKNQVIARMDSADIQARIAQAKANIAQSKAQLDQAIAGSRSQEIDQAKARLAQVQAQLTALKAGNRPQEIAQAQAQVDAAAAKVMLTSEQVKRYQYLYQQGAEKKQLLEQNISEDRTAQANLREAQKRLALLKSGSRIEDIEQQKAAVMEAKAALELLESGSRPEEIAQRRASLASATAQLQTELVNLEDTVIRAPFSGVITQKYTNVGAFVTPTTSASASASATSSSIVALASGVEVLAQVPEADIGRIKPKQVVEIVSDAYPGEIFKGRVRLIAPEAVKEEGVTLFQIKVRINTGKQKLISGLNVDLTFLGEQIENAFMVPTVAIVTEKGNTGVLIPDTKNQPLFRPITIGSQVKDKTQILEGVKPGDRIFLDPPRNYKRK